MDKIVIVGSGASGVNFTLSLLKKGYEVTMLDVGYRKAEPVSPESSFIELKSRLDDPVKYFLGSDYEAVLFPGNESEYYGFPPSKNHVFRKPGNFSFSADGFAPLFSFARGGLAEAWTAGVDPFNSHELEDFPFKYEDIEPYYSEIAGRIGITGAEDDLVRFTPFHSNIMTPLKTDEHTGLFLSDYEKAKSSINKKHGCYIGRSRTATISSDKDNRKGCRYCGRCLWGCPIESIYTPSITLAQCMQYPEFKYVPGSYVTHFKFDSKRRITGVVAVSGNETLEFPLSRLVLAAGTLSSSEIFMNSIFKGSGEIVKLHGLMDNRQVFMPFINLKMAGKPYNPESYQYHQLALGMESENPKEDIHAHITMLKTALVHPIIQNMFFDLKASSLFFRDVHSALGIVNINFSDSRRQDNYVTLDVDKKTRRSRLAIHYSPVEREGAIIKKTVKEVSRVLLRLGCLSPSKTIHIRPPGASVHYSGTLPAAEGKKPFTVSEFCQSNDFDNLYFIDGTTLGFLPSKNVTFTLMANAIRVAECVF
ncbi:MAG: hypothetical protein HY807_04900 [Nitrospirae bacterium]|nr:hypothetical protein [Nitrospirota bacterium]